MPKFDIWPCSHGNKNFSKKCGSANFLNSSYFNLLQRIRENWGTVPEIAGLRNYFWPFDPNYQKTRIFGMMSLKPLGSLYLPFTLCKKWKKSCDKILTYFEKYWFWAKIWPFNPNLGKLDFFSKIWLRQFLVFMDSYFHAKNQKKLKNGSWDSWVT